MTKRVQRIIHEIEGLKSDEKSLLIQTLLTRGLVAPYVDPFVLLRENIPDDLSDQQVGETIGEALRRVRHTTPASRGDGQKRLAKSEGVPSLGRGKV